MSSDNELEDEIPKHQDVMDQDENSDAEAEIDADGDADADADVDADADADDDHDNDGEEESAPVDSPGKTQKSSRQEENGEDDDEEEEEGRGRRYDDDDDEDEEDDEEDDEDQPKRKKRRPLNPFIEMEATVDDEEEEEDEDEDGEFVEDREDELEEVQKMLDTRAHRELDRRREEDVEMDAEEIAERMKERYGRSESLTYRGDMEHIPQSMLMPSVEDPKLWLCKVREGKERDVVMTIMRRFFDREHTKNPLQIYSAFARDTLKGYIYVESRTQAHVLQALDGINHVFLNNKLRLVPVDEMVDCLSIKTKDRELRPNQWVRAKKGKYAGDLGQILDVNENGEEVTCKFVPRLDPRDTPKVPFGQKRKKGEARPPARLFNPMDFKGEVRKEQGYYIYNGDYFDPKGYLEKPFKITSLEIENVQPTLDEIQMFSGGAVTEDQRDLENLASQRNATGDDFNIGESVEVASGAMIGIYGTVHTISGDIVTIQPDRSLDPTLRSITVAANELRKRFSQGDHVRVVNGLHKDETGMIMTVKDNIVTLLSDSQLKPIEVFSKDLRAAADGTTTAAPVSPYNAGDLVFLTDVVGVVTKAEKDMVTIISQFGQVQRIRPQQIRSKRDSSNAMTQDANGNTLSSGTTVDVLDPNHPERRTRGTVLHIYRQFVFVKCKELVESGGVIVAKAFNVTVIGAPANGGFQQSFGARSFAGSSGPRGGFGGGYGGGRGGGRGRGHRDPLLSKSVTITWGPYKGYVGIVKEIVNETARVELHTNNKIITVDRTKLIAQGENGPVFSQSQPAQYDDFNSPYAVGKTPIHRAGAFTPGGRYGDGGRTPAWDASSRTPAYGAGGRTPAWDASSRTPAYGAGGRTPAWDAGSRTPAHGGGRTPAWNPGSKTPAWDAGSKTPGFSMLDASPKRFTAPEEPTYPERLEVTVKSRANARGVITSVEKAARTAQVQTDDGNTFSVSMSSLEPVRPTSVGVTAVVLSGKDAGFVGQVFSRDGADIILKDGKSTKLMNETMIGVLRQ
ncbi:transcription elongation factor spt5 [Gaertneriomyces sp. JEL0708]|nr:transcription elongation factor spt5 [Gaertneriomyces sp. JEL0708]